MMFDTEARTAEAEIETWGGDIITPAESVYRLMAGVPLDGEIAREDLYAATRLPRWPTPTAGETRHQYNIRAQKHAITVLIPVVEEARQLLLERDGRYLSAMYGGRYQVGDAKYAGRVHDKSRRQIRAVLLKEQALLTGLDRTRVTTEEAGRIDALVNRNAQLQVFESASQRKVRL